jgi:DnaJ domain
MSDSYSYRPKFTDIRIRKPMSISAAKEEPKNCEAEGCILPGKCKAPKSRENPKETWWFCEKHAAEYNKNWNFFDGMSDGEQRAFNEAARHGHRHTWNFGAKGGSRESATMSRINRFSGKPADTFHDRKMRNKRQNAVDAAMLASEPIRKAYAEMDLTPKATSKEVRAAYAEMVRRFHPDSNGGDRSAEAKLNAVVKAYKVLKSAKRA